MTDKYIKINTLWKRNMEKGENKGKIIEGEYSRPEFKNIKLWKVSEKIHGANTRIMYHIDPVSGEGIVSFGGKTDDAQMPIKLFEYLQKTFTKEKIEKALMFKDELPQKATLYAEGYGPRIQKGGGRYRDDVSVILFDAFIDGWWLDQDNVTDIAQKLGIDRVPDLGVMTEEEIIDLVKNKQPISKIAKDKTYVAEGIVARSYPLMLFRDGTPIMFKLKVVDFKGSEINKNQNKSTKKELF